MFVKFNFWGFNVGVFIVKYDLNIFYFIVFGVVCYSIIGVWVFFSKGWFDN